MHVLGDEPSPGEALDVEGYHNDIALDASLA